MGNTPSSTDQSDYMYFRSLEAPTLKVVVGDPDPTKGEVAPKFVQFEPFSELMRGREGRVRVGYLKTRNGSAIKKLMDDANVENITAEEYEEATTETFDNKTKEQLTGVRAHY